MPHSNFPGGFKHGVTIRNMPVLNIYPAKAFWVDSNSVHKGLKGTFDSPCATLAGALALCTANKGDLIMIKAGHAENLAAAQAITPAGVTIVGLGEGNAIPTFTTTATDGGFTIGVANVTIENVRIISNIADCVAAILVEAAGVGCTIRNCQFRDTSSALELLLHVSVEAAVTDLLIDNCSMVGKAGGAMTNSILFAGLSTDCIIQNCNIFVDSSDDVIDHLAIASVNLTIRNNVIVNADTDAAGYCIRFKTGGTGVVHNNLLGYNENAAEIGVGDAAFWFENYASNTIAESGVLDPTTAHAIP